MLKRKKLCPVIAIALIGCGSEVLTESNTQIKTSDHDAQTYLSCDNFRIDRADNGLVIIDNEGLEVTKSKRKHLSRLVGPTSTTGGPGYSDIIPISFDEGFGYLMPSGNLFANQVFENVHGLYKNTLAFEKNGKWGLIDNAGFEILKPVHDKVFFFEEGRWMVTDNEENYFVDMDGKRQPSKDEDYLSLKYGKKHSKRSDYISCPDGTRLQSKNGLWGIVDAHNNVLIEPKFTALHCLHNDLSFASNDTKKAWCFINRKGEFTDEPCKKTHPIHYQHHVLPERFSEDRYENSVLWMRAYLEFGESNRVEPPRFENDGGGWSRGSIAEARYHTYHPMMKL